MIQGNKKLKGYSEKKIILKWYLFFLPNINYIIQFNKQKITNDRLTETV